MHYFSDSDLSDFDMPGPISPKKIDLTTSPDDDVINVHSDNVTSLHDAISRLERCIEKSGDRQQLRCQLSILFELNRWICIIDYIGLIMYCTCLLYTSPSPRDATLSRMPSSA